MAEEQLSDSDDECFMSPDLFINRNYIKQTFDFEEFKLHLTLLPSASTDFDLTGQIVWPCAKYFSEYLLEHRDMVKGKRVLELGAGVGLCGLVAHKIGARTCVITEGNDDVMQILQQNVEETKSSEEEEGEAEEEEDSLPLGTCLSAKLEWGQGLDLFKETYGGDFEVIIGSDIIFFEPCLEDLVLTMDTLLAKTPEAVIVLAYSSRSRVFERKFMSIVERYRYSVTVLDQQKESFIVALRPL